MLKNPVQKYTVPASHLARYLHLFVGRKSDFATQRDDGRYVRVGRPLTTQESILHLRGAQTIGTYVIDEYGKCRTATYDDDTEQGLERLHQIQMKLADDGFVSYLEQSRRGGHLWVFFAQPLPASQVRDWLLPYALPQMEFYPKQAEGLGYGSLIRLPLGVHCLTGNRYPFVYRCGPGFCPVATHLGDLLSYLKTVQCNPVPSERLYPLAPQEPPRDTHQSLAKTALTHLSYSSTTIHAWCAMQNPFSVIGRYVSLNHQAMASCPFHEHHANGKDRHPSLRVYEPTRVGGSCWYCYTWNQGGNVFDFLCHWYSLDARTMWQRIQKGEVV